MRMGHTIEGRMGRRGSVRVGVVTILKYRKGMKGVEIACSFDRRNSRVEGSGGAPC